MIKILYIISDQRFGGGSRHVLELMDGLDKSKFKPVLISIPSPILARVGALAKTYQVEMKSRIDLKAVKAIQNIIGAEKPDLIHLHSTRAGLLGTYAAKNTKIPIIYTEHLFADDYVPLSIFVHHAQIFFFKRLSKHITKVIAVSEAVKRYLVDKKIFPAGKIEVIYHGVKIDDMSRAENNTQKITVGTIGNLNRLKGYRYLLESLRILKSENHTYDFQFEIVGPGTDEKKIKDFATKYNLDGGVKFYGEIENVHDLIKKWDIYVQPSLSESFGLAVAEAMSYGIPVIATRVGGLKELVSNDSGILVEPKNAHALSCAIMRLSHDQSLRKKLGQNAQRRIKKYFSFDDMIKKTEKMYLKTINK